MQTHKRHSRRAKRGASKSYRKGSKSKTMKGKKDFTTKKSSKVFNRKGHYEKHAKGSRKLRRPYMKGGLPSLSPTEITAGRQTLNKAGKPYMKGGVKSLSPAEITAEHERLRLIEGPRIPAQLRQEHLNETIRRNELVSHVL